MALTYLASTINKYLNFECSERSNGYDWSTTAWEVAETEGVDMTGKNVLITGGYAGIGLEAARVLGLKGARVILAVRDIKRGNRVVAEQLGGRGEVVACDLSSLRSVRECAAVIRETGIPLHVLVCNAGVFSSQYTETEDGCEEMFQVNYLSHYLLTSLLLPQLAFAQPSRVIMVSSSGHHIFTPNPADVNGKGSWYWTAPFVNFLGRWRAYGASKGAQILFVIEMARQMKARGLNISANAAHPGAIVTGITRHSSWYEALTFDSVAGVVGKTMEQGAATVVYLCMSPRVEGVTGQYFSDCNLARPDPRSSDPELARRLWAFSQKVTGASWDPEMPATAAQ